MGALGSDWRPWFYFLFLEVGGASMTVLLTTLLWRPKTRKNPLLLSLCFSWWFSTFPCLCVLFYAGMVTGPEPPYRICLTSAVFTMSQALMAVLTPFSLIFHVWLLVRRTLKSSHAVSSHGAILVWVLVVLPYVGFGACAIAVGTIGAAHPELVHRALFYCVVDDDTLTTVMSVLGAISLISAIVFAVWILIMLQRNRTSFIQKGMDTSLLIRVCIFGAYTFLGVCLNFIAIVDWTNPIPDLFISTCPLAVFCIFGSSSDVWRTWSGVYTTAHRSVSKHSVSYATGMRSATAQRSHVHTNSLLSTPVLDISSKKVEAEDDFYPAIALHNMRDKVAFEPTDTRSTYASQLNLVQAQRTEMPPPTEMRYHQWRDDP